MNNQTNDLQSRALRSHFYGLLKNHLTAATKISSIQNL